MAIPGVEAAGEPTGGMHRVIQKNLPVLPQPARLTMTSGGITAPGHKTVATTAGLAFRTGSAFKG
jgi:hypothetical protein